MLRIAALFNYNRNPFGTENAVAPWRAAREGNIPGRHVTTSKHVVRNEAAAEYHWYFGSISLVVVHRAGN
ncbi:MAG: hypothetical protein ACR2G6_09055, partial [Gemmatimonadaceae bacterium]